MSAYEFDAKILVEGDAVGRIWTELDGRSIEIAFVSEEYRESFRKCVIHMVRMPDASVEHLKSINMLDKTLAGALSWFTIHVNEMRELSREKTVFCVPDTPPGDYYFDHQPYRPGIEEDLRKKYDCPDLQVLNPMLSKPGNIRLNQTLQNMIQHRQ